jgi:hypothetical protein
MHKFILVVLFISHSHAGVLSSVAVTKVSVK